MLKFYKRYNLLLIIPILTFLMVSSIYSQNEFETNQTNFKIISQSSASYSPHGAVYIANDDMLSSTAVRGSGTIDEPYILERWNITSDGSSHAMLITGTTKYFTIQDCWITSSPASNLVGIFITGTSENTVKILNNTISGFAFGIYLDTVNNVTIQKNICEYNSERGISIYISNNILVVNNTCRNNDDILSGYGIHIVQSSRAKIIENRLLDNSFYGVRLYSSSNCIIHNNIFINNSGGSGSQGFDDGTGNIWYDSDNNKGNYWDNWIGTGTYSIDGSAGAVDSYPLAEPTIFEFQYSLLPIITIGLIVTTLFISRKKNDY